MEVNTVSGILYEVKAKAIIDALVEKVENKTLGERLAEVEAKVTLADRLVAVEVDTLRDKLSILNCSWRHLLTEKKRWMTRLYARHLPNWTARRL